MNGKGSSVPARNRLKPSPDVLTRMHESSAEHR